MAETDRKATARKKKVIVRNSRIHGRGVYAARKIREGETIIEYRGERTIRTTRFSSRWTTAAT
jgi:SET domain-containing protein